MKYTPKQQMNIKEEGYMYGAMDEGSYWCPKCKKGHHKLSKIGKDHEGWRRF